MLLLTVEEVLATRSAPNATTFVSSRERMVAFATLLPLNDALQQIKAYSDVYKQKYTMTALDFRLISVANIGDDGDENLLRDLGVETINRSFAARLADA
ncbi:hypothetical protein UB46_43105 [Burkholderiaceae bacterium 16]|nr:hypothetical protein UB46_43105 [Burkholderiaceae bacterium 16]